MLCHQSCCGVGLQSRVFDPAGADADEHTVMQFGATTADASATTTADASAKVHDRVAVNAGQAY